MAPRVMTLRRQDRCARCAATTRVGDKAYWDDELRALLCLSCVSGSMATPGAMPAPTIEVGRSGERRSFQAQRESALAAARSGGATIEEFAGPADRHGTDCFDVDLLRSKVPDIDVVRHRLVPGTGIQIDVIVVAPSGVWIVDRIASLGGVERRDVGTVLRVDERLIVGGVDRTDATTAMGWQVEAVRRVIAPLGLSAMPIHPVLCFTEEQWALLGRPFRINGTLVSWPAAAVDTICTAAPLFGAASIEAAVDELHAELPTGDTPHEVA